MTIRFRLSALLLVIGGGLAVGGSFGTLAEEFERAGAATLTLTYTAWRLAQGGSFTGPINFHAPHFGIPLVVAGALAITAGVLLALDLDPTVRSLAVGAAGLLVGAVWAVGMVVSADLDAVTSGRNLTVTWSVGAGFWLVLTGGVLALAGGIAVLVGLFQPRLIARRRRVHPIGPPTLPVFQPPVLSEPPDSA